MNNAALNKIKAFGMTNQMLMEDLTRIQSSYAIELGHLPLANVAADQVYYPQIDASVRAEASEMSAYYEVFYSLEKSIRALVSDTIGTAEGTTEWWDASTRVPPQIKNDVQQRIQKEMDAGVTLRSDDALDYTTFGELSDIIISNWDIFGGVLFQSKKALQRVMANLNTLRNPIAHCTTLAEDEKLRLQLSVRDWFRLLE
jgi:hypothetical protein